MEHLVTPGRTPVLSALDKALQALEQAVPERWMSFSGESLEPQMTALAETLKGMRDQEAQGVPLRRQEVLNNLLRFTADWIPDTSHPLLGKLGDVLSAVELYNG